jgi:hypothetical protein
MVTFGTIVLVTISYRGGSEGSGNRVPHHALFVIDDPGECRPGIGSMVGKAHVNRGYSVSRKPWPPSVETGVAGYSGFPVPANPWSRCYLGGRRGVVFNYSVRIARRVGPAGHTRRRPGSVRRSGWLTVTGEVARVDFGRAGRTAGLGNSAPHPNSARRCSGKRARRFRSHSNAIRTFAVCKINHIAPGFFGTLVTGPAPLAGRHC